MVTFLTICNACHSLQEVARGSTIHTMHCHVPAVMRLPILPSTPDRGKLLCLQMPYLRFVKMLSEAAPQHSVVLAEVLPQPTAPKSPPFALFCPAAFPLSPASDSLISQLSVESPWALNLGTTATQNN